MSLFGIPLAVLIYQFNQLLTCALTVMKVNMDSKLWKNKISLRCIKICNVRIAMETMEPEHIALIVTIRKKAQALLSMPATRMSIAPLVMMQET